MNEELDEDSTKSAITILEVPYAQRGGGWYDIINCVVCLRLLSDPPIRFSRPKGQNLASLSQGMYS